MTIKQLNRKCFWDLLDALKSVTTKSEVLLIAVHLHSASGAIGVPKAWRKYINPALQESLSRVMNLSR